LKRGTTNVDNELSVRLSLVTCAKVKHQIDIRIWENSRMVGWFWMMNWKVCGMTRSWPILRYDTIPALAWTDWKLRNQNRWWSRFDPSTPKYDDIFMTGTFLDVYRCVTGFSSVVSSFEVD